MKHLKRFETIHKTPQVGDYVLCAERCSDGTLKDFISSNIGVVVRYLE